MAWLTTLSACKTYLGIDASITTWDDRLTQQIDATESWIVSHLGLAQLSQVSVLETFFVEADTVRLVLPTFPVSTLVLSQGGATVDSTDYWLDSTTGLVYHRSSTFPAGVMQASYLVGYTTPPAKMIEAAHQIVAAHFARTPGLRSEHRGKYSWIGDGAAIPPEALANLASYVCNGIGG